MQPTPGFDVEIDMIGDLELESDNGDGSMNSSDKKPKY